MINLIKFIHVLFALGLLGITAYCTTFTRAKRYANPLFLISLFAFITGSLLIYPKHFTFHTAWIQAAYFLLILYACILGFSLKFFSHFWLWRCIYFILISILILIIHDAVTKHTILYFNYAL